MILWFRPREIKAFAGLWSPVAARPRAPALEPGRYVASGHLRVHDEIGGHITGPYSPFQARAEFSIEPGLEVAPRPTPKGSPMDTQLLLLILLGAAVVAATVFVILRKRAHPNLAKLSSARLGEIAASKAVQYVDQHRRAAQETLEYKLESLKRVDRILEKNFAQNSLDAATTERMGMYLGETIRRLFGGQWKFNEGFGELCIELEEEGFIFPVSQIRRALEHKETGQISSYVESIDERQRAAHKGKPLAATA